jgi:hypothetical protein
MFVKERLFLIWCLLKESRETTYLQEVGTPDLPCPENKRNLINQTTHRKLARYHSLIATSDDINELQRK